ncbi:MAG: hypothetical protein L0207_04895 [Chlamydiae bacterium]|nr:hypothetical protein [Chlamydiota bacterium]
MTTISSVDPDVQYYVNYLFDRLDDSKDYDMYSSGPDVDLIVSKNDQKDFSVHISLEFKNIIILGKLSFNPLDSGYGAKEPKVVARNIYFIGNGQLTTSHVTLQCLSRKAFATKEELRKFLLSSPKNTIL